MIRPDTTREASAIDNPAERDNPPVADDARFARLPPPGDPSHRVALELDAEGRLPPGSVPGWGLSWWLHEQGLLPGWEELPMHARLDRLNDYWRAVSQGWGPSIPRDAWVGSCHPWQPGG